MAVTEEDYVEPSAADLAALATFMPSFTIQADTSTPSTKSDTPLVNDEAEEFDFNLFSTSKAVKVSLQEPTPEEFEAPTRPMSYYIHTPTPLHMAQIESIVLTGSQVREQAKEVWPTRTDRVMVLKVDEEEKRKKRWRPSMARRRKFKELKVQEEEKEKRRLELRSIGRNRGRGRGGAGGGGGGGRGRGGTSLSGKAGAKLTGGYPRKGGPDV